MADSESFFPTFDLERRHGPKGRLVAGVDEAGRGPLAGPVVAAAVILDPQALPDGLDDSKRLSAAKREALYATLLECAQIGIGIADVARIDLRNILWASMDAMAEAVAALPRAPAFVLADGNRVPALPMPAEPVVKGDQRSLSIAAASIVAKVTRDRLMDVLARDHPAYGWEHNRGYPTPEHLNALARHGATAHHRRSFAPVRRALGATS